MSNVYYNPEDFGLKVVAELDYNEGGYEFDKRVVWRHKETGRLYTARDAGCSCPSPFEDYDKLEDLDELLDMAALREEARSDDARWLGAGEAQAFLDKVARVAPQQGEGPMLILKCVDCSVSLGKITDKNVPVRCNGCRDRRREVLGQHN